MRRSSEDILDELLIVRCQRNDASAWDALVERYQNRLLYFIRKMVGDEDLASQLVQEAWLRVLRQLHSIRNRDRFKAWIYTIARRVVIDHLRDKYRHPNESLELEADHICDENEEIDSMLQNAELVHFGLEKIGMMEREILTLHFIEDLSTAEIASILEIPRGTVKSRLFRARMQLKEIIENELGSESVRSRDE